MNKELSEIPLVSIRLMTFNHEKYIEEALQSIDSQKTNFNFEVVIGDDFSSDNNLDKIKNYCFINKKLSVNILKRTHGDSYYLKRKEKGRLFNFVDILNNCRGKYIALLDGDDYWTDPLKLQKQVDMLEANPQLVACHHWQYIAIKKGGRFVELEAPIKGHGYFPQSTSNVENIFSNQVRLKTRTVMFRNIISKDFFPSWFYKVAFGDVPLSFLLGMHGDFGFIDEPMAVYRNTEEGASLSGLKELGRKKFKVQHFKNWIQIWDYADKFYGFKYHKEASETVLKFYKKITANLPITVRSFIKVLYYDIFERKLPFQHKLASSKWIVFYYLKKLGSKLKRKITTS
ncbi:glycosyltransferase [Aequorivita antarctica]|uniref:Glycosyltransferase n=1 Tax=Aequorivita antarctica TaxID=153266 RepID=A0A5C6YZK1_9FLAO|nr:glycosyltransferase [Aequorivita antarctica]TXD72507.1 glycosyltransferase [Aequorivita antarctica]SRX75399.1 hypothetical protein AEQU3_02393 [Aequorivita antarctica]